MSGQSIAGEKLRLGFIGCGGIAQYHAKALTGDLGVDVAALSDPSREAIARLKNAAPILRDAKEYTDYSSMIEKEELDGVLILSPHVYHREQIVEALRRGIHVLVEKPMVVNADEARDVLRMAESSRRVVAVAYQRRTDGLFNYVKRVAGPVGLGAPVFIEYQLSQDWTLFSKGTWRADPRLAGGGFLMDSGSHVVDMMLWFAGGLPREVYAALSSKEGWGAELFASITARWDGCTLCMSLNGDAPLWSERLRIYCEGGLVAYLEELGSRSVWVLEREAQSLRRPVKEVPPSSSPLANFVRAVRGLEKPAASAEDGFRVALFKDACYRSAKLGAPVRLS
ncbi:MAG: Gfo/Idh/MocA family oxidoreductase [Aigarchaeota archaeon]|nr:Gfo/Idh/MocA family oxidoreductase [Candidatus Calditenuaceae archaeon]